MYYVLETALRVGSRDAGYGIGTPRKIKFLIKEDILKHILHSISLDYSPVSRTSLCCCASAKTDR